MRRLRRHARIAASQGRDGFAIACLRRIVEIDVPPAVAAGCFCDLGEIQRRRGEEAAALEAYVQALRLAPRDVGVHLALGQALGAQGLAEEAANVLDRAARLDPGRPETAEALRALRVRGHLDRGEWAAALTALDDAAGVDRQIDRAEIRLRRAAAFARPAAPPHAAAAEPCAAAAGATATAHASGSGSASAGVSSTDALEDVAVAIRLLRAALNARPRDVRACRLLVEALERAAGATGPAGPPAAVRPSIAAAQADAVGALFTLGLALQEAGDLSAAAEAYETALARKPDCLRAWLRLADVRLAQRAPAEAVRCLDAALAIDPDHPTTHVNLGWALRINGDFARGWTESAWNYRAGERRRFEQPAWDGAPLGTRTLLLWADFALGDTIQDLRYLPLIRSAHPHARLVLECDRRLVRLVETCGSALADTVVTTRAPLPAFDLHLPLRRLPEVLGVEVASIPSTVPYLALAPVTPAGAADKPAHDAGQAAAAAARAKSIGLVWAGDQTRADARIKSATLADFEPLLRLARAAGLHIVSLQLGETADETIALPPGLEVERVLAADGDVADTAAVMHTLDLVITVDTMIAHLAGALGLRVWVAAAFSPAWWLWQVAGDGDAESERSLWYPTMRVFRQDRAGDWEGVLRKICNTLRRDVAFRDGFAAP